MFLVNSRLGLAFATLYRVPLLPKLRGHFAEFLERVISRPLVYSTYLPVSVSGTGIYNL